MPKMTNKPSITAQQFLDAWCDVWEKKDKNKCLSNQFSGDGSGGDWTKAMLTGEDAFLKRVAAKLGIKHKQEKERKGYYRLDMVFLHDEDEGEGYPSLFDVMIEHENDRQPENEMWKLIFLRSPLKVIIFYHSNPEEKIKECVEMLCEANKSFPENPDTDYLFIIGTVDRPNQKMYWRWASDKKPSLERFC